jgi:hypothetical protein
LEDIAEKDLMIGDRHFCIVSFLCGIAARGAVFAIGSISDV